ncbi:nuclear GTPase SLIP-GC [Favolaschia claudopus]|uniref:Nuclear GTPase SLIP-GC n=1 Tax=Favolaschia claudopus TaxID=2862362 RepID=A0AAW0EBI2_9AGAR
MSSHKENMGQTASVKMEPTEYKLPALASSNSINVKGEPVSSTANLKSQSSSHPAKSVTSASQDAKPTDSTPDASNDVSDEPNDAQDPLAEATNADNAGDITMEDAPALPPRAPTKSTDYKEHESAAEIEYTPEETLQETLKMVNKLVERIEGLELGPLRKEVWLRETTSLRSQSAPTTLIAICGGTGAGKSSSLNAILDDNIVPTSGMRACTAVVTEIAYHKKKNIEADVSFLSKEEWKAELQILIGDLVEEDGTLKRSTDLKSDAGVAWQKVHAVYPKLSQEKLVTLTPDEIIAKDPKIERVLGNTKKIVAADSKIFSKEIGKYIDSKDQRRGKDKEGKSKDKNKDPNAPAFWPLIRQVNVRCNAAALSTGAVLVDLPGTGDANAARNSIAKSYMKRANCVWVLAPIQRAVDEKVAKDLLGDAFRYQLMMDGGYDANTITFIASKCDDISCSEVIGSLGLHDDLELEEIQEKIERISDETTEHKVSKMAADKAVKSAEADLKRARAVHSEYKEQLECFEDGKPFVPKLTAKAKKSDKAAKPKAKASKSKKRKNSSGGKKGSPKRRRSSPAGDDDEDKMDDSDDESDLFKSDIEKSEDSDSDKDSDFEDEDDSEKESDDERSSDRDRDDDAGSGSDDEKDSDREDDVEIEEEVTEESIKHNIAEAKKAMDEIRARWNEARKEKKAVADHIATLKKKATTAQKEKNAFCSRKRSEFSRDVLKEDFRSGLRDLDEAAAEERDPANFDPSVAIRDYEAIDLPVFTVSSRDYVRIKKQIKGDGEPSCFSNVNDTGIPELQQWCHHLTKSSRERAAKNFMKQVVAFANDVKNYVAGIGQVTSADRETLREQWESGETDAAEQPLEDDDPFAAILGGSGGLYTIPQSVAKRDRYGHLIGITPRLQKEFEEIVEETVENLNSHLSEGLDKQCRIGAANAADAAVTTSDEFASSMHWGSYRATLRRNGEYRRDLNVELVNPFTRNIAQTWQKTFEADIFGFVRESVLASLRKLVDDISKSAAPGLVDRTKLQGESCMESAQVALDKSIETVKETLNNEQKEVSRSLAPHVQSQLLDGYESAMEERGKGSVARQKAVFHRFVVDVKDEIFENGADVIMDRLTGAADAVGKSLTASFDNLAQKIEVNLAVLWEDVRDDPTQKKSRSDIVSEVNRILRQLQLRSEAEKARSIRDEDTVMS